MHLINHACYNRSPPFPPWNGESSPTTPSKSVRGASGPYHKLQHWREGKNHTRYVSAQELPAVQAALAGYAQYRQLTEQYADLVIEETRQQIAGSKKKKFHRKSSWPKTKKSNA